MVQLKSNNSFKEDFDLPQNDVPHRNMESPETSNSKKFRSKSSAAKKFATAEKDSSSKIKLSPAKNQFKEDKSRIS